MTFPIAPKLVTRRHVSCCGKTFTFSQARLIAETPEAAAKRVSDEVAAWAKNHLMTCPALKALDDDDQ